MNAYKAVGLVCALLGAVLLLVNLAAAEQPSPKAGLGQPRETTESLQAWQWFLQLQQPAGKGRYGDCLLPPGVLDKARADLADLRLRDARGQEIPFALSVRKPQDKQVPLKHKEINRGKVTEGGVTALTLTLDLGEGRAEHNAVEIAATGNDFRRKVRIEGSDNPDKGWTELLGAGLLTHVHAEGKVVDVRRLVYPVSRFRYLRLHVFPDRNLEKDNPEITSVIVLRFTQVPGLDVTLPAQLKGPAPDRVGGAAGSIWTIDFDGLTVPCGGLIFDVADDDFLRSYRIEAVSPNEPNQIMAEGQWRRRASEEKKPLEVRFDQEATVQQLRLVVTDYNNPALTVTAVRYRAAARQLTFELTGELAWPLQLYFGNPRAQPANYDFARLLPGPGELTPPPVRAEWSNAGVQPNPDYQPEPKPWTERWPWLVYVVLGTASVVLLAILVILGPKALATADARQGTPASTPAPG
jgi:hypothetical protein